MTTSSKPTTAARKQILWGGTPPQKRAARQSARIPGDDLAGYVLLSVDRETGAYLLQSPNAETPYSGNFYHPDCSCPGFQSHGRCKHSKAVGYAWRLAWGEKPFDDFLEAGPLLSASEMESDFRQYAREQESAQAFGRMVA